MLKNNIEINEQNLGRSFVKLLNALFNPGCMTNVLKVL